MRAVGMSGRRVLAALLIRRPAVACSSGSRIEVVLGTPTPSECDVSADQGYWSSPHTAGGLARVSRFYELMAEPSLWCEQASDS
jgi:hypothetical protein